MALPDGGEKPSITWPKPTPPGPDATIGTRVEYSITLSLRNLLSLVDDPLIELFSWALRIILRVVERTAAPMLTPLLDYYIANAPAGDPLKSLMTELKAAKGEAAAGMLLGLGSGAASAGLMSFLEPFFERARQLAYTKYPSRQPDPGMALAFSWRNYITSGKLKEYLLDYGFDEPLHDKVDLVSRPRIDPTSLGAWMLRATGREGLYDDEMEGKGYLIQDIVKFKELLKVIPPVQDIIRMAVREAWRDDFAANWGTDQDYMSIVGDWAEKVGLSAEWVKRYWRAHWELPSVMMGYEMLHRGVIDITQLKELMRALDIMPGWRDKLIQISYAPYTRVDLRRMHKQGVLDEAALHRGHLDLGYEEERATRLDEFVIKINTEEDREATKTDILTGYYEGVLSRLLSRDLLYDIGYKEPFVEAYLLQVDYRIAQRERKEKDDEDKKNLTIERELTKSEILSYFIDGGFTETEARSYLADLDYPTRIINILIAKAKLEEKQRIIQEVIKSTKILYINEEIDVSEVHVRLGKYGMPAKEVDELLILWNIERDRRTERPGVSELLTFYYELILDEDKLREQLSKHKFSKEYIDWYVAHSAYTIRKRELEEKERKEREQERIEKSKFKTARMVALAALDVQIQTWRVYIADQKVAALYIIKPEEKKAIAESIVKAQAEIAALELAKAKVPVVPPT